MLLSPPSADLFWLERTSRVLLSPLRFSSINAWQQESMHVLGMAFGAHSGTFLLPHPHAVVEVMGLEPHCATLLAHHLGPTWSHTGPAVDASVDVLYQHMLARGPAVWNLEMAKHLLNHVAKRNSGPFCHEVISPYRLADLHALFVPRKHGSALLTLHHFQQPASPDLLLSLLRMVLPSFMAGVDMLFHLDAHRTTLDMLTEPLIVFDRNGVELHRNPAFSLLLFADTDAAFVFGELRRMVQSLIAQGPVTRPAPPPMYPDTHRLIKTNHGTYRVRGTVLEDSVFHPEEAVLIIASAATAPPLPTVPVLRERYGLTRREAEVALLLAEGLSNTALAARLFISPHTARHHTQQVLEKLSLSSRKALALRLLQTD